MRGNGDLGKVVFALARKVHEIYRNMSDTTKELTIALNEEEHHKKIRGSPI